jgi:hypothetical protein
MLVVMFLLFLGYAFNKRFGSASCLKPAQIFVLQGVYQLTNIIGIFGAAMVRSLDRQSRLLQGELLRMLEQRKKLVNLQSL